MKPFHTNHCGVSFITGAVVHVMHYIEPEVIVAQRLLKDVFSLIYSEVSPKRSMDFFFSYGVGVYRQAYSGIPLAVRFVGRDRWLWNSMVQGTQRFRQVRAASCIIPYVMCGSLYCLRC